MNQLVLSVQLVERGPVRYTPAGLPAIDFVLKHESQATEAGQPRKVSMEIRAVAIGDVTRPLALLAIGSNFESSGFLASQRNGRGIVYHITQMQQAEHPDSGQIQQR